MNNNARFSGVFTVEESRRIYKATGLLNCGPPPPTVVTITGIPASTAEIDGVLFWIAHHAAQ